MAEIITNYSSALFFIIAALAVIIFTVRWIFFPKVKPSKSDPGFTLSEEARKAVAAQQPPISSYDRSKLIHELTMVFLVVILFGTYAVLLFIQVEIPKFLETALTLMLGYYFADKAIRKK